LENKRADYGKKIVSHLATQLSWACFIEILPLKTQEAKLYYLSEAARGLMGRNGIRKMISRNPTSKSRV